MIEYTKNLNILYVEDDEKLMQTTQELFKNYFKSVDVALNGEEGLEKYINFHNKHDSFYDLIITDINMPKLNGLEMGEKILSQNPLQNIIITTAHNESRYLLKAIELGIDGFISKPIDHQQLIKVLYKTSQAISDHKFVESHVELIENLNIQLEEQNSELLAKNAELEKSFRMLDTVLYKEKLSHKQEDEKVLTNDEVVENQHKVEQIHELVQNDLFELKEVLLEIDVNIIDIINDTQNIHPVTLTTLASLFAKYSSVLGFYNFFNDLSKSIADFSYTVKESPLPEDKESIQNIFMLLESFIYVLGKWHDDISSGDESKINQFDASIISDIDTIQNMWTQKEELLDESNLDDIFDF